jgi:hypothetical protein
VGVPATTIRRRGQSAPQSGARMLAHTAAPRVSISGITSYAASDACVRRCGSTTTPTCSSSLSDRWRRARHLPSSPPTTGSYAGCATTCEFFAGFQDAFRTARVRLSLRGFTPAQYDSYDGGTGYVFVIASWQPMRFEQFTENERWQSFEIADDQYLYDPRPAIEEFAALLTGENRDAYTVRYARYYNTYYFPAPVFTGYATYSSFCSDFGSGF